MLLTLHWFGCRKGRPADKSGSSDTQTSPEPSVSHGANSVLVQASSAVEMQTSPAQGRFLQVGNMHGHFLGVGIFRQKMIYQWCHCTRNCVLFVCVHDEESGYIVHVCSTHTRYHGDLLSERFGLSVIVHLFKDVQFAWFDHRMALTWCAI